MLMFRRTTVVEQVGAAGSVSRDLVGNHLGIASFLGLSAWCGVISGLLEVGTIVLRKQSFDSSRLYGMSRHFVWLIPLTNLFLFLATGVVLCVVVSAWPHRGRRLATRLVCALALLPSLLVAFPQIYGLAWLAVVLGVAMRLVPALERHAAGFWRAVLVSFPVVLGLVVILALSLWGGDRISEWRERTRALPPPGSPSVLLIVLDAVAASHMNLYGYERPTSPTLVDLAARGIRFNFAQASSSWTLPSHANMFTGRWPHELSAGWQTPLDETYPTLAEFLGAKGYATAGFVANNEYCARDSGLGRGFTEYHDYIFPKLTALKMAALVDRPLQGIQSIEDFLLNRLDLSIPRLYSRHLYWLFVNDRKDAPSVNRQFLDWLARRQPERPFFAFLNYFDAHWPYQLTPGRIHRFGFGPKNNRQKDLIQNWWSLDKSGITPQDLAFACNSYDDCVADLDEQIGRLFDALEGRGKLEKTWVIIVADHGESFGEHARVFSHGTSLYQTELHVPLVVIPPAASAPTRIVGETVSLRDLAATIVDLLGLNVRSPFPGDSLARYWNGKSATAGADFGPSEQALAEVVPNEAMIHDPAPMANKGWPLAALIEGGWTYIRRGGDVREELFHLLKDAGEQHNLATDPAARSMLERMRAALDRLTAGPLTPGRFKP
jgi:arylsulfatase A-like enzyme